MPDTRHDLYDVAVFGGGNAGLSAALTAREAGARVLVIERAPRHFRGGNSRHTRNLRCVHADPDEILTGSYSEDEFFSDLIRVSGPDADEDLARLVVRQSAGCVPWMRRFGVRFQPPLRGTLNLARTNAFFLGGGKALLNSLYAAAADRGIDVMYDAEVVALDLADGLFHAATVRIGDADRTIRAKAAVVATGGFEANVDWLREIWGDAADNFIIRGTPYNTGTPLKLLLDAGVQPVGDARECHAVAVDARAPKFDGGIVTRLDCLSLGIVVNVRAERFYDEGEDFWPKRYAIWGALVARQPGQMAFSIVDAKAIGQFMPSMFPPAAAGSIRELALQLGLPADALEATVDAFNRAVRPGSFDLGALDDCRTVGARPEKSHWARRIDTPPYLAYPLRPGITFTYLGVKVNQRAQVVMNDGRPVPNLCAAGEIMAGNVLRKGYVAGVGMTIGAVSGRIAGDEAQRHAAG